MKIEFEGSKETHEVMDAVSGLIADLKAKKPITEIIGGNFAKLQAAVDGIDKLDDEAKVAASFYPTVGYHVGKLASALAAKPLV